MIIMGNIAYTYQKINDIGHAEVGLYLPTNDIVVAMRHGLDTIYTCTAADIKDALDNNPNPECRYTITRGSEVTEIQHILNPKIKMRLSCEELEGIMYMHALTAFSKMEERI